MKMNDDNAPTHTNAFKSHCGVILMKPTAAVITNTCDHNHN